METEGEGAQQSHESGPRKRQQRIRERKKNDETGDTGQLLQTRGTAGKVFRVINEPSAVLR